LLATIFLLITGSARRSGTCSPGSGRPPAASGIIEPDGILNGSNRNERSRNTTGSPGTARPSSPATRAASAAFAASATSPSTLVDALAWPARPGARRPAAPACAPRPRALRLEAKALGQPVGQRDHVSMNSSSEKLPVQCRGTSRPGRRSGRRTARRSEQDVVVRVVGRRASPCGAGKASGGVLISRPLAGWRGRLPAAPRRSRSASCASCRPSASRAACACG
jgi:hypothetical protein